MEYIPLTRLTIGDKELYYYGERRSQFDNIHFEGDPGRDDKFIAYYSRGGVVCGFMTYGYTNLHLFLIEAMKMLLMPRFGELKSVPHPHRAIVNMVVMNSESIRCNRMDILNTPSSIVGVNETDVARVNAFNKTIQFKADMVGKKRKEERELREKKKKENPNKNQLGNMENDVARKTADRQIEYLSKISDKIYDK